MTARTLIQAAPFFFFFNTLINAQTIIVSEWHVPSGNPYTTGSAGSIVVGDGSMDSANSATFYGVFDEILLADGMTISPDADLTLAGGSIHSNQMRFGVYDSDGSSTDTGWLGYFSQNNLLHERNDPNTNSFTFDRIGFLLGSSLGVDQATLSNVTIITVPEP